MRELGERYWHFYAKVFGTNEEFIVNDLSQYEITNIVAASLNDGLPIPMSQFRDLANITLEQIHISATVQKLEYFKFRSIRSCIDHPSVKIRHELIPIFAGKDRTLEFIPTRSAHIRDLSQ